MGGFGQFWRPVAPLCNVELATIPNPFPALYPTESECDFESPFPTLQDRSDHRLPPPSTNFSVTQLVHPRRHRSRHSCQFDNSATAPFQALRPRHSGGIRGPRPPGGLHGKSPAEGPHVLEVLIT